MLVSKQDIDAEARQNYAGPLQSQTSPIEFGYYAELACSRDVLDFKTRIGAVVDRLGFSDFAFVRLASRDADFSMLMSTPSTLLDSYCQEGLYENDMMFSYAKSKVSPIYRSTLDHYLGQSPVDTNMTRTMEEIYKLNKSLGYYDYYHIPSEAMDGDGKVMFSVTLRGCSPLEFKCRIQGCESTLRLLSDAIDLVATRKFAHIFVNAKDKPIIAITPKPLLVLETLANNDFTVAQIADHLNISPVTVSKHLETARKALGVRTNHAAIKKAFVNDLIAYK
ncbi:MAG: autoinducer binding domain-containing protein [Porticoccaceae bacterium]|nr:autoinducer binding domain-containing protein [Porticoccaceae bacterium]